MDSMSTDHVLSTTRAVRLKLDLHREVEPEVVYECLRLAIQAPSPSNRQAWRWIVVRDQQVKDQLGELFRDAGTAYLRNRRAKSDAAGQPNPSRLVDSVQHLIDVIEQVPVFVIPCVLGRPRGFNAADAAFYGGIFPAVWSFQLALRSRGLGSTLTTFHLRHEQQAAAILGLPDDVTQVGLLPVAYTTVSDFRPAPRQPVEEVAFADRWGQPLA